MTVYMRSVKMHGTQVRVGALPRWMPCGVPTCTHRAYRFVPVGRILRDEDGFYRNVVWLCDDHHESAREHMEEGAS